MIFPDPVTLKRFAAPLCVLSFIFMIVLYCLRFLRCDDRDQVRTFHPGLVFHCPDFSEFLNESFQKSSANALMDDFSSPEKDRRFNFVSLLEKAKGMILLELVVVFVRIRAKLDFLNRDVLLMLLRFVLLLVQLVKVLAVIHDPTDRWICSGSNFNQIQTAFFSNLQCGLRCKNSKLFVVIVDNANLPGTDSVVHPDVFIDTQTS